MGVAGLPEALAGGECILVSRLPLILQPGAASQIVIQLPFILQPGAASQTVLYQKARSASAHASADPKQSEYWITILIYLMQARARIGSGKG